MLYLLNQFHVIFFTGGMMIKNGERRRTPGGVFLQLLRDYGSDENEARVKNKQVKLFFAQSNHRGFQNNHKNKKSGKRSKEDFNAELEAFKKLSKNMKKVQNTQQNQQQDGASGDSDLKPLPDILTCISQKMSETANSGTQKSESFDEPNAPPNSVERTLSSYDDDFLSTEADTEDIELF